MKMKITRDVVRGRIYAGPVLPAGSELLGTIRAGALIRLSNGVYVEYAQGEVRMVHQGRVLAALEAERERELASLSIE